MNMPFICIRFKKILLLMNYHNKNSDFPAIENSKPVRFPKT